MQPDPQVKEKLRVGRERGPPREEVARPPGALEPELASELSGGSCYIRSRPGVAQG